MLLHPDHILVIWTGNVQWNPRLKRRRRARVFPFVNFGMAVRKCEPAGSAMITGGIIHDVSRSRIRITIHLGHKISVINAVPSLIQNNESHRRSGVKHFSQFAIDDGFWRAQPPIAFVTILRRIAIASDPVAHRDATTRDLSLWAKPVRCIRRTMPYIDAIAVRPDS